MLRSLVGSEMCIRDRSTDEEYVELLRLIREGKNASHISKTSKAYGFRRIMDLLCIETYNGEDVLVYDGCRLVVPKPKREAILALLHAGHSGIAKTYKTAIQLYYWPNMKSDIEPTALTPSPFFATPDYTEPKLLVNSLGHRTTCLLYTSPSPRDS